MLSKFADGRFGSALISAAAMLLVSSWCIPPESAFAQHSGPRTRPSGHAGIHRAATLSHRDHADTIANYGDRDELRRRTESGNAKVLAPCPVFSCTESERRAASVRLASEHSFSDFNRRGEGWPATEEISLRPDTGGDFFWWEARLAASTMPSRSPMTLTLNKALGLAISQAPELQILRSEWYIQRKETERQAAAFDWTSFVDAVWNRDSSPVGSDLDGAARRLRSRALDSSLGARRLAEDGTEITLAQEFGTLNSNSQFINPNNQGTSRLSVNLERPLLRGAGRDINTASVQLARLNQDTSFDRFQTGVQDHLLNVASAYWTVVLRRGRFLQSVRSWKMATGVLNEMKGRVKIDVTPAMLNRAQRDVADRLAGCIEAEHDLIRAQDALLRLIYGSQFTRYSDREIVTVTTPMHSADPLEPHPLIERAIRARSEIHESIREIKAASVRLNVAHNQVQPMLNFVLTGYVAGLRGNNDLGGSFLRQFTTGEPGIGVGFNFEIPYRNRAAKAAAEQSHMAVRRMQSELQATIGEVAEDVRTQVIQRQKFAAVLRQQENALRRARDGVRFSETRRALLADGSEVAELYLQDLLQMQSRLADAEYACLQSQVRLSLADNSLLRAVSNLDSLAGERVGQPSYRQSEVTLAHPDHAADMNAAAFQVSSPAGYAEQ